MARSENPERYETRIVCAQHSVYVEWSVTRGGPVSDVECEKCARHREGLLGSKS